MQIRSDSGTGYENGYSESSLIGNTSPSMPIAKWRSLVDARVFTLANKRVIESRNEG